MAATIARAQGYNKHGSPQNGEATRLGAGSAVAAANTWRTFTSCRVDADGSGYVCVRRDGKTIHEFVFGAEEEEGVS